MIGSPVESACEFEDWDGFIIGEGVYLGTLVRRGKIADGFAYNTINNSKVTAVIVGNFRSKVQPFQLIKEASNV